MGLQQTQWYLLDLIILLNYLMIHAFLIPHGLRLLFTILAVISVNIVGLTFAFLVTSKLRTANAARTMVFMPYLIGGLILGYIWQFVFSDVFTLIGEVTGFDSVFFNWLMDPDYALYALVFVFTWQMAGYVMIIYIAGIQGIPSEVIEASKIDGANIWQRLRKIIFPLLMPSFTISLFLTLSSAFKIYDANLSLTGGGPANSTEMFAMNIYNEIFGYGNYGFGQAKAIIFFFISCCHYVDTSVYYEEAGGRNVMKKLNKIIKEVLLLLVALFFLSPIYIIIVNSFKDRQELYENVLALPENLVFSTMLKQWKK